MQWDSLYQKKNEEIVSIKFQVIFPVVKNREHRTFLYITGDEQRLLRAWPGGLISSCGTTCTANYNPGSFIFRKEKITQPFDTRLSIVCGDGPGNYIFFYASKNDKILSI